MNEELTESKKVMRDAFVKRLNELKFDGTDVFTETEIRDRVAALIYLMEYEPDNQIFTLENKTFTLACWMLNPPDKKFTKDIQKDLDKIDGKIKKEKEKN